MHMYTHKHVCLNTYIHTQTKGCRPPPSILPPATSHHTHWSCQSRRHLTPSHTHTHTHTHTHIHTYTQDVAPLPQFFHQQLLITPTGHANPAVIPLLHKPQPHTLPHRHIRARRPIRDPRHTSTNTQPQHKHIRPLRDHQQHRLQSLQQHEHIQ